MINKEAKEKEFLEAYNTYSDAIFRYCYYRVFDRDMAKDLVQETYCRAWKYISEGKHIENMRALLYRIANNMIIDESRKKKSFSLNRIMEKGFSPSLNPLHTNENYFIGKEILDIVKSLDEKYRDVIIMKYINDLSTKEIAFILNETENNIYVRVNRGFEKVKKIFLENQNRKNKNQ